MRRCSFQFKSQGGSQDQEFMRWHSANQMGRSCPIWVKFHQCQDDIPFNRGAVPRSLLSTGDSHWSSFGCWVILPNWSYQKPNKQFSTGTPLWGIIKEISLWSLQQCTLVSKHGDKHRRVTEILVLSCSECPDWHSTEKRKTQKQSEEVKYIGSASCILAGEDYQGRKNCEVNTGKMGEKPRKLPELKAEKLKTRKCKRMLKCQGMEKNSRSETDLTVLLL